MIAAGFSARGAGARGRGGLGLPAADVRTGRGRGRRAGGNDGPTPLTLDIAVTGCASLRRDHRAARCCTGTAPLVLSFSPVGSPEFTALQVDVRRRDDPLGMNRAPMHAYALPGSYQMSADRRAPGERLHPGQGPPPHVEVEPGAAGAPCDVDAQCATASRCACAPGTGCPPHSCAGCARPPATAATCGPGAVCASLALGRRRTRVRRRASPVCVAACQTDPDCAPGFVCQTLPAAGASNPDAWTRGCVPIGALADLGAPCRNANGSLDDAALRDRHLRRPRRARDLQRRLRRGSPLPRPNGLRAPRRRSSALSGRMRSVRPCARDPLLACATATTAMRADGFQVDAAAGSGTYCAPKACSSRRGLRPLGSLRRRRGACVPSSLEVLPHSSSASSTTRVAPCSA